MQYMRSIYTHWYTSARAPLASSQHRKTANPMCMHGSTGGGHAHALVTPARSVWVRIPAPTACTIGACGHVAWACACLRVQ